MKLSNADNIYLNNDSVNTIYLNNNQIYPKSITDGLILHLDAGNSLSYGGSGTTWSDLSSNGYNGTLTNGPTYNSSDGGSIVTDGVNDFVIIGPVANTGISTQSVTFEVWVNPSDNDGNIFSMSQSNPQNDWNMPPIAAESGRFKGKIWQNTLLSATSDYVQGNWYQVVILWDYSASTQRLYVNGILEDSESSATYSSSGVSNYLYLGQENPGADNQGMFGGKYSMFRVYSRALSSSEVLSNYNNNKDRFGL